MTKYNSIKKNEDYVETIKIRKKEGIDIPLNEEVQGKYNSTLLEDVYLIHNSLPEIDFDEINTSTHFLRKKLSAPTIIDSMTGGTDEATIINERLGRIAENYNIAMGLGSQRAGLKSDKLVQSYSIARKVAPNAFLIANIGGAQLSEGLDNSEVKKIIDMIDADALAIHLNPLQELIQPEGEPKFKGVLKRISKIIEVVDIPVIVKEVGAGISAETAIKLSSIGVSAINVAGSGGTSWAGIEKIRADKYSKNIKSKLGQLFWDWGIPTALSIILASRVVETPLIASGGLRNGLDLAKCLILGSNVCAMAFPFLKHASISQHELESFTDLVISELKATMFLVGSQNIESLINTRYILKDNLANMLRNYDEFRGNKD